MIHKLLPLALLVAAAAPATTMAAGPWAYPIDPASLLQLVEDAAVIVVADVDRCFEHEDEESVWSGACARLDVRETLAGPQAREPLHVAFTPGLICPTPARYVEGERVLAFLRWDDEGERLRTCSLSYGTKYPDEDGLEAYRARLAEVPELLALEDAEERLERTVEWLVACAEHPATLGEAAIELGRYRRRGSQEPSFAEALTPDQCRRLARVIAGARPEGGRLPGWTRTLMSAVASAMDDAVLDSLVRSYRQATSLDKQRRILTAFAATVARRA